MEKYLRVGVITATHALKGEVKVFPTTDDVNRFKQLKRCIWQKNHKTEELEVVSCRFFKNQVILKFKGIDHINDVERYVKGDLLVSREDAVPCEEGEYYIADLIGLSVITDDGKDLGHIIDVLQTGANDVYVVEQDGRELLLPVIKDCILNVDLKECVVTVHLMKGLLEK
ncbi:MAG: ribosome maturation factor RimM [Lachnospiraceae bacterium]